MGQSWRLSIIQSVLGHALLLTFAVIWAFPRDVPPVRPTEFLAVQLISPPVKPVEKKPPPPKVEAKQKKIPKPKPAPKPKSAPKSKPKSEAKPKEAVVVKPDVVKPDPVEEVPTKDVKPEDPPKPEPPQSEKPEAKDPPIEEELLSTDFTELLAEDQEELAVLDGFYEDIEEQQHASTVAQYSALIREKLKQYWSRPPTARNGMEVVLRVHLLPGGRVRSVEVLQSSGDVALDHSAKRAVQRARDLPVPEDREIFNQYFRSLRLPFRPEDLRI